MRRSTELALSALTWLAASASAVAATEPVSHADRVVAVLWKGPADDYTQRAVTKVLASVSGMEAGPRPRVVGQSIGAEASNAASAVAAIRATSPIAAVFVFEMDVAREVQLAHADLPIVFDGAADPMQMCLVHSLVRPGGSATGATTDYPVEPKMLEAIVDAFPNVRTVLMPVDANNLHPVHCTPQLRTADDRSQPNATSSCVAGPAGASDISRIVAYAVGLEGFARSLGVKLVYLRLCTHADFARLKSWIGHSAEHEALVVPLHLMFLDHAKRLVESLNATGRPVVYARKTFLRAGGLIALQPIEPGDRHDRALELLVQVLRGRAPADLPVQLPRGFELWINHDAITAPHLRPSLKALRRADGFVGTPR